jgi:hypothetical protein
MATFGQNGEVVGSDTIGRKMRISVNADDDIRYAWPRLDLGFTLIDRRSASPEQGRFLEAYVLGVLPAINQAMAIAARNRFWSKNRKCNGAPNGRDLDSARRAAAI